MAKQIGLKEAMSIGIGGMVGGGIFAVLGLAVALAQGGTPVAFFFAGIITILTAYSYAKLSQTYPDRGRTVRFINQGFGITVWSGALNNLLWLSYIIMLSLYASAFGSYAPNLWMITDSRTFDFHIYATAVVLIAALVNYYSIAVVGKIESYAVGIKLVILLAFVAIGGYGLTHNVNIHQLSPAHWEAPFKMLAGGMVIFVAYEGFELIANAAPDIVKPEKNIARAYYYSVIFVIILYVVIAIVTVGSLPFTQIAQSQDYVLAEAAKPMLGQAGFTIITIAALISTFSAINASLYGGSQVNYEIAKDKELPPYFLAYFHRQPIGLLVTTISTLILVNTLKLESISAAGSVGFLLIFAVVNAVAVKLAKEVKGNRLIPFCGAILCSLALVVLLHQQWQTNKNGVYVSVALMSFCMIGEWLYRQKLKHASPPSNQSHHS